MEQGVWGGRGEGRVEILNSSIRVDLAEKVTLRRADLKEARAWVLLLEVIPGRGNNACRDDVGSY